MWVTGLPGQGPVRAGIAVADSSAGLYAAIGILVALSERERSGEGQWVRSSLLQAQIAMMDFQAARYLVDGVVPATGRQRSSVFDADGRREDRGRLHQYRGRWRRDSGSPSAMRSAMPDTRAASSITQTHDERFRKIGRH